VKTCALAVSILVLAACSKNIQNPEAVKEGVIDYLKQRAPTMGLDMNAMDVNVGSISFEKDIARANVSFVPKGMPGSGGMSMEYVLERKGDKWAVKGRQVSPGNSHGDQPLPPGGLPPGHPPADSNQ
jgi:hypothetical protein